ncbi:hypothetical protein [Luteimonas sp. YGD11-2]|uniref:hypothetical protein n=1 Tax=Luteimonas sp. YGD11-2 TaxID=2508168 RepID=UPI00100BC054|nr:hypothetical protein [Luteimonas sp. YGD11-2]
MAAVTGTVVAGALTAYGASQQAGAAKDAAKAQSGAAQAGIAEQQRQFDMIQRNLQPYMGAGTNALAGLTAMAGGDYSAFENAPDYQFAMSQGLQARDRSAAARGGLYSGGADADRMAYAAGLASQNLGNHRNHLMDMARMGQNSAAGVGAAGQNAANAMGNLYAAQGNAQAGAAVGSANAWTNALAGIAGGIGQYTAGTGRSSAYSTPNQLGAFAPNVSGWQAGQSTGTAWNGNSAFGAWGQGWRA